MLEIVDNNISHDLLDGFRQDWGDILFQMSSGEISLEEARNKARKICEQAEQNGCADFIKINEIELYLINLCPK